jgi:hypothetical protein
MLSLRLAVLAMEDDILPPTSLSGEVDTGRGSCPAKKSGFSGPARKLLPTPPDFQKNHCPCILESKRYYKTLISTEVMIL